MMSRRWLAIVSICSGPAIYVALVALPYYAFECMAFAYVALPMVLVFSCRAEVGHGFFDCIQRLNLSVPVVRDG